jgi:hypothetical protein
MLGRSDMATIRRAARNGSNVPQEKQRAIIADCDSAPVEDASSEPTPREPEPLADELSHTCQHLNRQTVFEGDQQWLMDKPFEPIYCRGSR